jgi:hypothetical protein
MTMDYTTDYDGQRSLKSETVNMVASPKGLEPENDCAG